MVFEKAWRFLKASRQSELGEFHPDFPSSYGPVTMRRFHPVQNWPYKEYIQSDEGWDEKMFQPYESLIHEGLRPIDPSYSSISWEEAGIQDKESGIDENVKPFDLEGKQGNWFFPTGAQDDNDWDYSAQKNNQHGRKLIGVRKPLDDVKGQFRNTGFQGESAEAYVENFIPPQQLVQLPMTYIGQGSGDWGARGE